jgi:hypothetical protein
VRAALAASVAALIATLVLATQASAQVPPVPAPVQSAVDQVVTTVFPLANQAAVTAGPAVVPAGFALRPGCGMLGGVVVLAAIAGFAVPLPVPLPVGSGTAASPALIVCSYAYEAGPADPVFVMVDDAVGPTISSTFAQAVSAGGNGFDTIRSTVGPGCLAALAVEPGFHDAPPPANRLDPFRVVC